MKFNVPYKPELDNYTHITTKMNDLWGSRAARQYLMGLMINTSGRVNEKAKGFTFDAIRAIDELLVEHDQQFPQFRPQDHWRFSR